MARERQAAAGALNTAGACISQHRMIRQELEALNPRRVAADAGNDEGESVGKPTEGRQTELPLGASRDTRLAERFLHGWFWPLIVLLSIVEFLANAPVFAELFPQDAQLDALLREWLDPSGYIGWSTGAVHLVARLVTSGCRPCRLAGRSRFFCSLDIIWAPMVALAGASAINPRFGKAWRSNCVANRNGLSRAAPRAS